MKRRIFLLSLLLLVALATWRIARGPIPVDFLTPYFEEILSRNEEGWRLNVGETVLAWRGWSRPIDLNLRDVEVRDRDDKRVVNLPVVSVGLSLRALLHGKVGVRRVDILRAELLLERDEAGRVAMGDEGATTSEEGTAFAFSLVERLLGPADAAHPISFLERVRVEAERVTWSEQGGKIEVTAAPLTLDARRTEAGLRCELAMQLDPGTGSTASGPRLHVVATAQHETNESADVATLDTMLANLAVTLSVRAEGLQVAGLARYWPPQLANSARSWVIQNVRPGVVDEAVVNLALERENGQARLTRLDGTLRYSGLGVRYLEDWPNAESVDGKGSFDRHGLRFAVASGSVGDLDVGLTTVEISGLDSDEERIRIQTRVTGGSNAVADLVTRSSPDLVELLALDRAASTGHGTVDLEVRFPLHDSLSLADVAISARADLPGLSTRNDYVQGEVGASVHFEMVEGGKSTIDLDLDVSKSAMAIPSLGWRKEDGVSGRVELTMGLDDLRLTTARDVKIDAGTLQARAELRFRDEGRKLESLDLTDVSLGKTRLSTVTMKDSAEGLRIDLGEGNVDVEAIRHGTKGGTEQGEGKPDARVLVLNAPHLGEVSFGANRHLEDVRVHAERHGVEWRNVDVSGKTPGTGSRRFKLELEPAAGGHQNLAVSADDAGSLLMVLGGVPGLRGGRLNVTGRTTAGGVTPVQARVEMREYAFLRASLLTRLLTVASGRGFGKLTTEDAVAFDYLGGDVTFAEGRFRSDSMRAHGPALGFTAKGWADIEQSRLSLDGAIVPAYAANRILGKIPLLGSFLSGDGDEGFWAIRYRMSGNLTDPKMEVDALKSLTPAFLRDVFGKLEDATEW